MNPMTVLQALEIMWKGMLGVFLALIIIMISIWLLSKL